MKVIADSSSTRTEWVLVDGTDIVEQATTAGINPYFQTRREISHLIRLGLPESFFRRRWEHIFFYGAGCHGADKLKVMESSLVAQFKTPVTVQSDLLGAARGLLIHQPGLACILATGSNSCSYDGENIVDNVRPLGFILGDEGSNSYLGKKLLADILKGVAPEHIRKEFHQHFDITTDEILDSIYSGTMPSRTLAEYSFFLVENLADPYAVKMIYDGFMAFFSRNIIHYDYANTPVSFVGSTAVMYEDILRQAAADFGVTIGRIVRNSMPGLIQYHAS